MALEEILGAIETRARAEADGIRSDGEKEAERIINEAEKNSKGVMDSTRRDVERRIVEEINRSEATERIEGKKRILYAKRELIENSLHEAAIDLRGSEEYKKFMKKLVNIAQDAGEISISKMDRKMFSGLRNVKEEEILGGAIIMKGEITFDYSLDSFLDGIKGRIEKMAETKLFGEK